MSTASDERRHHWENLYRSRSTESLRWYQPHLKLLQIAGLSVDSRLIDIGAGASTLIDDLLETGRHAVSIQDVSPRALDAAQPRLGERATRVRWCASLSTMRC